MNLGISKHISIAIFLLAACSIDNTASEMITLPSEPCDCAKTFEELVEKLESNYIGLALITDTAKLSSYNSLKNEYSMKSNGISADTCTQFLEDFLSFFEDGHLFAFESPQVDSLELVKNRKFLQNEAKSLNEIDELSKDTSDPIVGYWTDGESIFRIVKNQSYFDAYLVKSNRSNITTGSLKLKLRKTNNNYEGTYYTYDFNARYVKGNSYKENQILKMGSVKWNRVQSQEETITKVNQPSIKKMNSKHTILTIPSFSSIGYKDFKNFLKDNRKLIRETNHLIIDIRGNTGGNGIYFPLIGYFATHPFISKPGYVLTSDANRAYFQQRIGLGSSRIYSPLLDRMSQSGKIVEGPNYPDRKYGKSKTDIQRVSILMDNGCASAAESFILHAKGSSDKVTTFGSPSKGMIDFTSVNLLQLKNSGNQNIYFGYPTGTLHKDVMENGYNKTGIIPDVAIPTNEDKIQYIMDYYK